MSSSLYAGLSIHGQALAQLRMSRGHSVFTYPAELHSHGTLFFEARRRFGERDHPGCARVCQADRLGLSNRRVRVL
jgi:hypothetical protein